MKVLSKFVAICAILVSIYLISYSVYCRCVASVSVSNPTYAASAQEKEDIKEELESVAQKYCISMHMSIFSNESVSEEYWKDNHQKMVMVYMKSLNLLSYRINDSEIISVNVEYPIGSMIERIVSENAKGFKYWKEVVLIKDKCINLVCPILLLVTSILLLVKKKA